MINCVKNFLIFRSLAYSSAYYVQCDVTLLKVIITSLKHRIPSAGKGVGGNGN